MKKIILTLAIASISFASQAQSNLAESKLNEALQQIQNAKVQLNRTERSIRDALVELQNSGERVLTQEVIVPGVFSNMCGQNFANTYLLKDTVKSIEANLLARCRSRGVVSCEKDLIIIQFTSVNRDQCKVSGEMHI